jgi:putative serine protease PepD
MLGDAVAGATAEANLIGLAISSGVPAKLRQGASVSVTAQELQQTSSVQQHDAEWAVTAIAEALGIQPSAPMPAATSSADAGATSAASQGAPGADDLIVRGTGVDVVVRSGTAATIGRDPGCTIILTSTAVSRQHARLARGASGWEYTDVGSAQGSFADGSAVRTKLITQSAEITLGQGASAVRLQFLPGGDAAVGTRTQRPDVRLGAPATEIPNRPGGALGGKAPATVVTGGDSLTVTLNGASRVVSAGGSLTVGREDDNDLVASGSTVSRHHLRIEQSAGNWQLKDLGSSSGTWLDGKRVTEAVLSGGQEFVLGDQSQGDRLTTQTAGASAGSGGGRRTGVPTPDPKRPWLVPAIAVAVVVVLVGGLVGWKASSHGSHHQSASAPLTRNQLAQATVYIEALNASGTPEYSGSGVIVDKSQGLIMTNAHVGVPAAVGQAIPAPWDDISSAVMSDEAMANPAELDIYVTKSLTSAAEPSFIAKPIAWDGYLDVAILKITKTASGSLVEPSDLTGLTQVDLGNSNTITSSEQVEFYGYPGVSDSLTPTFTSGTVSSPVQDDRLNSNDAVWNSTATIEHGNSGGLAVDAATHKMIGIPTWVALDEASGAPVYSRFRPINLVKPVLTAAEQGKTYVSPYAQAGPSSATAKWNGQGESGCTELGTGNSAATFDFTGFPGGSGHTDVAANLYATTSSNELQLVDSVDDNTGAAYPTTLPSKGCVTFKFSIPAAETGASNHYTIKVGVGGDLHLIYDQGGFTFS